MDSRSKLLSHGDGNAAERPARPLVKYFKIFLTGAGIFIDA